MMTAPHPTTSRLARCRALLEEIDALSDRRKLLLHRLVEIDREIEAKEAVMHETMRADHGEEEGTAIDPTLNRTAYEMHRRSAIRERAIRALRTAGGKMSNTDLALALSVDYHGLLHLLIGDSRILKTVEGPPNGRGRVWWVLP